MSWEDNVRKVVPYVAGEQPKDTNVIKLNTNECPYPPSPLVEQAIQDVKVEKFRLYPDMDVTDLKKELASYYGIKSEQVFVGVGSDDVLSMSFLTFFNNKEKPILFPDVTYSFYDVWADLYKIPYKMMKLDNDFKIVVEDYKQPNGGVVIANPNAPTGVFLENKYIEEIIKANPDVIVIIDEAYIDFGAESCLPLIEKYDNLLVVQTFSKSRAMAGMRIGFAMGNEKLIHYLEDVKFSFNSYTMNMTAIAAGTAAVKDAKYFNEITQKIIETREWTKQELKKLDFEFTDSKTNFLFAEHKSVSADDIFKALREKKIFVRHWNKERISNRLRITIGTQEQMEVFVDFLKEYLANK